MQKIRCNTSRLLTLSSMFTGLNLNKPTYICAKITMRCNSRCAHCNIWNMDFDEREMTSEQWFHVLDELRRWLGPLRMVFTGGEALLRDDLLSILEHAVHLGIKVELLSNGLIIDEAQARRIVASGIDQITISLDGISPAVHDRFRGEPGYHDKTVSAILLLNKLRREAASPLRILLKTVISANNLHELEAIARWAGENRLELLYQPIEQNYGEELNQKWYRNSSLWITDLQLLKEVFTALRLFREPSGTILNSDDDFDRYYAYFEKPETLMSTIQGHDTKNRKHCAHAVGNFVISSNGDVRMCFGMTPIGNVAEQSPQEIWQGRDHCWANPCVFR